MADAAGQIKEKPNQTWWRMTAAKPPHRFATVVAIDSWSAEQFQVTSAPWWVEENLQLPTVTGVWSTLLMKSFTNHSDLDSGIEMQNLDMQTHPI